MLTARDAVTTAWRGVERSGRLSAQAVRLPELLARVRALLRRDTGRISARTIRIRDIEIDTVAAAVTRAGARSR